MKNFIFDFLHMIKDETLTFLTNVLVLTMFAAYVFGMNWMANEYKPQTFEMKPIMEQQK